MNVVSVIPWRAARPSIHEENPMLITTEGNLVTLINVFDTTPEHQQARIDPHTYV
jgi:hypothetical protein